MTVKKIQLTRRDFIKTSAAAGTVVALAPYEKVYAQLHNAGAFWKRRSGASSYSVSQSLRFDTANSQYLSRTYGVATDAKKSTFSYWYKGLPAANQAIFSWVFDANNYIYYNQSASGNNALDFYEAMAGSVTWRLLTNQVFRDPSSWYHIVFVWDTHQDTDSDRIQLYVNGVRVTSFSVATYPSHDYIGYSNQAYLHKIGTFYGGNYLDGNLSEVNFVDGQALMPTAFGEFDSTTGQWVPKAYAGTYGNNGFYLKFADNSNTTAATLGKDSSPNANNWTPNNFSVNDQILDSPTNNFCTANVLDKHAYINISRGGLRFIGNTSADSGAASGTIGFSTGKFYWEYTHIGTGGGGANGIAYAGFVVRNTQNLLNAESTSGAGNGGYYRDTGDTRTLGTVGPSLTTWSPDVSDVIGVAVDADNGAVYYSKNGTWLNSGVPTSGASRTGAVGTWTTGTYTHFPLCAGYRSVGEDLNCGQGGLSGLTYDSASGGRFKYTPPVGFKALSTKNLPTPAIQMAKKYFRTFTYVGNGGGQCIGEYVQRASSYSVGQSLRLNLLNSQYLARTFTSAGNQQKWTWSGWLKLLKVNDGTYKQVFACSNGVNSQYSYIYFDTDDTLYWSYSNIGGALKTNRTFKETSKWFHLVMTFDSTNATANLRYRIFVDGVEETSFSTDNRAGLLNQISSINSANVHAMGAAYNGTGPSDFYFAEMNFIDGQALVASDFGQIDTASGEWVPKAYAGTYGANGFYLNFSDNSNTTAATLGKDSAPISAPHSAANNWTPTGTFNTYDQVLDSPTKNWSTLNVVHSSSTGTYSNGNLTVYTGIAQSHNTPGNFSISSGKYYWEVKIDSIVSGTYPDSAQGIGIADSLATYNQNEYIYVGYTGNSINNASSVAYGATYSTGSVIGVAVDLDNGKIWFSKNNTWQASGNPSTGTNPAFRLMKTIPFFPVLEDRSSTDGVQMTINFGQGGQSGLTYDAASGGRFKYTPPAGFKALHQANIAVPAASALAPDLVWLKSRSAATDHALYDSVRGATLDITSNLTSAETSQTSGLQYFTKGGFQLGNLAKLNTSTSTYVAWGWRKGATPGFDIVLDTGTGVAKTVAHSLGVVPNMIIRKSRTTGTGHWYVYHKTQGATVAGILQLTNAFAASTAWNSTSPTATLFSVGGNVDENKSGDNYVSYLFAEISGFSKFGSYTGNGSVDGPFVWCGFRPAYVMIKSGTYSGSNWNSVDSMRNVGNTANTEFELNQNFAEATNTSYSIDLLSNGFKIRNSDTNRNNSGDTYIFIAFAEAPFKYANAR